MVKGKVKYVTHRAIEAGIDGGFRFAREAVGHQDGDLGVTGLSHSHQAVLAIDERSAGINADALICQNVQTGFDLFSKPSDVRGAYLPVADVDAWVE
jgi:hypothetical protein